MNMKKTTIIFIISIFCHSLFAQIQFEKGYFIDSTNKKVNCLIKNVDWKNNPNKFEYMLTENATVKTATINNVIEFGIDNFSKYVKAKVKVDRSSDYLGTLSTQKQPIFSDEILFLLVIEEGKASLYQYEDTNIKRFFFKVKDGVVEPLVYKRYSISLTETGSNMQFRQQLINDVLCEKTSIKMIENLKYGRDELLRYFKRYNSCFRTESDSILIVKEDKSKKKVQIKVSSHLNMASLQLYSPDLNSFYPRQLLNQFKTTFALGVGVEIEYTMPFNKNKWRVFMNPNFHYYNGEREVNLATATVKYKGIELPFGIRYYMFLNNDSKMNVSTGWGYESFKRNQITFNPERVPIDFGTSSCFFVGGGYNYKKLGIDIRYYTPRNILNYYLLWSSKFQKLSAVLYYTF
jgi:hypothetical protein